MQQREIEHTSNNNEEDQKPQSFKAGKKKELWAPYFVAAIFAIASCMMPISMKLKIEKDLANPVLTMSAILIAFIATSMTIILASLGLKAMKHLQSIPGVLKGFVGYHTQAIWFGMIGCGLSMVAIIVSDKPYNIWHHLFFLIWSFCFYSAITTFVRVVHLLHRILIQSL